MEYQYITQIELGLIIGHVINYVQYAIRWARLLNPCECRKFQVNTKLQNEKNIINMIKWKIVMFQNIILRMKYKHFSACVHVVE